MMKGLFRTVHWHASSQIHPRFSQVACAIPYAPSQVQEQGNRWISGLSQPRIWTMILRALLDTHARARGVGLCYRSSLLVYNRLYGLKNGVFISSAHVMM